jgi:hypothetical protein
VRIAKTETSIEEAEMAPVEDPQEIVVECPAITEKDKSQGTREPSLYERREMTKKLLRGRSCLFSLRVLNQYVRCALGGDGLHEHLLVVVKQKLHMEERHGKRLGRNVKRSYHDRFRRLWVEELRVLVDEAHGYVIGARDTGRCTMRGHKILRGIDVRGRHVFMTLHIQKSRITGLQTSRLLGVYTGAQFNRKSAFGRSREASHHRAISYRRNKHLLRR